MAKRASLHFAEYKKMIIIVAAVVIAAAAGLIAYKVIASEKMAYGFVDIEKATLSFLRQGRIDEIFVEEGDTVKKDEVLARLNVDDLNIQRDNQTASCRSIKYNLDELENGYQQEQVDKAYYDYMQAKAQYEMSELTYRRKKPLHDRKVISEHEFDETKIQREQALSQQNSALAYYTQLKNGYRQEQVDSTRQSYAACMKSLEYIEYQIDDQSVIRAPFDGFIRVKYLNVGDIATPSGSVFEISLSHEKKIKAYLSEDQLRYVKMGDELTVVNHAEERYKGKVIFISDSSMFTPKNVITDELRGLLVYEVKLLILDQDANLRDGQSVSVLFDDK